MSKPLIQKQSRAKKEMLADSSTDSDGSDSDSGPEMLVSHQHDTPTKFSRRIESTFPLITKPRSQNQRRKRLHIVSEELKTENSYTEDVELSEEHVIKKKRKEKLKVGNEDVSFRKKIKIIDEDAAIQDRLKMNRSGPIRHSGNVELSGSSDDEQQQHESSDEEYAGNSGEGHSGISSDMKEDNEKEMKAVKEELSHLSFEELQRLKEKLGTKVFNQVMHGKTPKPTTSEKKKTKKDFKRANKSRPMEMSSKKTVPRYRQIIPVKKKIFRDPRFDDLSGEFSEEFFKKSYSFLDDVKTKEKQKLEKQVHREKDPEKKRKIKLLLNRMTQQEQSSKDKAKKAEQEKQWSQREKELVAQGKKPYFLKKSDKRKLELAEKYKELQESGKLEKYLSKKRKKNTQKERKRMPDRH